MKTSFFSAILWMLGCASSGGYAEPGPMSPSAWPPGPASVQSGSALQPSPASGTQSENPPTVNAGGAQVTEQRPRSPTPAQPPNECQHDRDCERHGNVCISGLCSAPRPR